MTANLYQIKEIEINCIMIIQILAYIHIVTCQAHPALVKQSIVGLYFSILNSLSSGYLNFV